MQIFLDGHFLRRGFLRSAGGRPAGPIAQFYTDARLTHSQTIMPMAQALAGMQPQVGAGHRPVRRLGGAAARSPACASASRRVKGMAQVLQKPCVPVSALEGLAFNLVRPRRYPVRGAGRAMRPGLCRLL